MNQNHLFNSSTHHRRAPEIELKTLFEWLKRLLGQKSRKTILSVSPTSDIEGCITAMIRLTGKHVDYRDNNRGTKLKIFVYGKGRYCGLYQIQMPFSIADVFNKTLDQFADDYRESK